MPGLTPIALTAPAATLAVVALLCGAACLSALRILARARLATGSLKATWITYAGIAGGVGAWAVHYALLLAGHGLASGYEAAATAGSLGLAVGGMTAAFAVVALTASAEAFIAAGLTAGVAIAGSCYLGLSGAVVDGELVFHRAAVILSVVSAGGLSTLALFVAGRSQNFWRQLAGAALLATALILTARLSLQSVWVDLNGPAANSDALLDDLALRILVIGFCLLVVVGGAGSSIIYARSKQSAAQKLRAAIEALPAGLGFYDAEDRLVVWNRQYAEIAGPCRDLLAVGAPFRKLLERDLAKGNYRDALGREEAWLTERLAGRARGDSTEEQQLADGRWLRVEDRRTADGGVVTIGVDITDLKQAAETLARAREEAEAANRAKSEFLANMSHEIRTPLNGVVGVADVLAGTNLDPRQAEMLDVIRSSARTLERLLSDVLDLARVESGRLEVEAHPFHLGEAVRSIAGLSEAHAHEKGVALKVELAPEADRRVLGDVVRLKQILTNLASNAVKFTDRGEVVIAVEAVGPDAWRLSVRDTGVGFDPAAKDRVFGRFQQADGSITRRFGGTGLGLSISRQLAELMGGELDCCSVPGEGSIFFLTLTLPEAPAEAEAPAAEPVAAEPEARPMRVLLADDHPTNRKVVELILAGAGVELISTENGAQAVEAFQADRFDAVLMDMQMPVMDGLTATREIRRLEAQSGAEPVPVVMLTANALPEHVEAGRIAGANRHLSKPITAAGLIAVLSDLADEAERRREAA
ncbi:ATP-binding protein [Caulobacter sp. 17J65-9]|uniref:hybrid sensor histidine kinase/response regulator n=1 Tax=Caulobacter sp. 17J65-9 TaxID=2709382 RepID=UPI0013C6A7E1|nr:ATP-binding protein [Caulobacter sp. 17J65-9]NEX93220.1 response regulator [Caulobacter sp. 17J65-9]